jgi:sigma-E factor negative regulatory protein RseC
MDNQNLDIIRHSGKVILIDDDTTKVRIVSMSACSSCHARGACSVSDMEEKVVEVKTNNDLLKYKVGDDVNVSMSQNLGFLALFLGYLLPLILVVSTITILSLLKKDDLIVGLAALSLLIPYYVILYLYKDKLKNKFLFKIDLL